MKRRDSRNTRQSCHSSAAMSKVCDVRNHLGRSQETLLRTFFRSPPVPRQFFFFACSPSNNPPRACRVREESVCLAQDLCCNTLGAHSPCSVVRSRVLREQDKRTAQCLYPQQEWHVSSGKACFPGVVPLFLFECNLVGSCSQSLVRFEPWMRILATPSLVVSLFLVCFVRRDASVTTRP